MMISKTKAMIANPIEVPCRYCGGGGYEYGDGGCPLGNNCEGMDYSHVWNYTPHTINIVKEYGTIEIPSAGQARMVEAPRKEVGNLGGITVSEVSFEETVGLPEFSPYYGEITDYYIVSRVVAEENSDRKDLIIPDQTVRDDQGIIIGCKGLARIASKKKEMS